MVKTIIVWFRNDLRLNDHPALAKAVSDADQVVPLFIFDPKIFNGRHAGSNRNRFLLECLQDLKSSLRDIGGDLVVRSGNSCDELQQLARDVTADAIYYMADYSPYAVKRDKKVQRHFESSSVEVRAFPGRLIVSTVDKIATKSGTPHKVFTPFWKSWQQVGRRNLGSKPAAVKLPSNLAIGRMPALTSMTHAEDLSKSVPPGG